jgi:hypothetical protein
MAELFETIMLICFGASWPVSVIKSLRSRSTHGKSLIFLFCVWFGYVVGLVGKLLQNPSYVIVVYITNLVFISTDIVLYFVNRRRELYAG